MVETGCTDAEATARLEAAVRDPFLINMELRGLFQDILIAALDNFCWPDPVQSEKTPDGEYKLAQLVRTYFRMDGHHIQFNVVDAETLREAQENPEDHRDLIVRVAGYSAYFNDLSPAMQQELIDRSLHCSR